jgi:hypothetical protein
MTHLDDAALVTIRDGESADPRLEQHLRGCAACRARLAEARKRGEAIESMLSGRPGTPDAALAKARVRRRLDTERAAAPRLFSRAFRRAAAILAMSAGAAYAVPGSPVPGWLGRGESRPASASGLSEAAPAVGVEATPEAMPQEAVLVPVGPRLELFVEEVAPGREVEVLWLEGSTAWISAGPGARYSVAGAGATVRAPNGPVRLGIPRTAAWVSLRINGRMVFEGTSDESSGGRTVFPAPGR